VSQGTDLKNEKVAAFHFAKLNLAQQNCAVHETLNRGVRWRRDDVTAPGHPVASSFSVDDGS
jgi:hypothetical protein